MQIFLIFDRYISKIILSTIMKSLFVFVSLSALIKFVDQLKKAGQGDYESFGAGMYTILTAPKDIQSFFPMAALLGTLVGLGMLAQRSELVVMQTTGYTRMQVSFSVMKTIVPLLVLIMSIGEWVAPKGEQMARNYRARAMYGGSLLSIQRALWAKDGRTFIYIESVRNENELDGLRIYSFNQNHRLQSICYAEKAKFDWNDKLWRLSQIKEFDLQDTKQITSFQHVSGSWKTNLTPDKLGLVVLDPAAFSISNLLQYIEYLNSSGQNTVRYQLNMWRKIFQPISALVMVLIALSFLFGPLCSVSMGVRILTGMSVSFCFYVVDQIFIPMILVYGISPMICALFPSILFLLISLWLLLKHS